MTHRASGDEQTIRGADAMEAFGASLAVHCPRGTVIALRGDFGAGKTTLVRGLAAGLGLDPARISSPTFVLLQLHEAEGDGTGLAHLDAWRIESVEELAELGWEDLLDARDAVIAVEWPERVEEALPAARLEIVIDHGPGADERTVRVERRIRT